MLDQRERRQTVRGVLPVAVFGLFVAAVGILLMQWPTFQADDSAVATTFHINRVIDRLNAGDVPGALADGLVYVLLIIGGLCVVVGWARGRVSALMGLAIIGLLGLAYMSGVALYNGPMIGVFGFALITFSGVISWAVVAGAPQEEPPAQQQDHPIPAAVPLGGPPIEPMTESVSAIELGSGYDDASHSVA